MHFVLTLHSHLPYVLNHGRWPHGSDWICEAAVDTYLPLLESLRTLEDEGVAVPVTLGITPVLANQLASEDFRTELGAFFSQRFKALDEAPISLQETGVFSGFKTYSRALGETSSVPSVSSKSTGCWSSSARRPRMDFSLSWAGKRAFDCSSRWEPQNTGGSLGRRRRDAGHPNVPTVPQAPGIPCPAYPRKRTARG